MNITVCAVNVTYNRKTLLLECLDTLTRQTRPLDAIYIIDNSSTDGTQKILFKNNYLAKLPPLNLAEPWEFTTTHKPSTTNHKLSIHYVRMHRNTGGAGGFHEGIKRAYEEGYDWLWLMDDDTIPNVNTLNDLLTAYQRFPEMQRPILLASRVIWIDGTLHPMNIPTIKYSDAESLFLAAQFTTISLRSTSFVSLLLNKKAVELYGLPIADYFIWNDDVEYTARILRNDFGVLVPNSTVLHKTQKKHVPANERGTRYYYEIRNKLWMLKHSKAWSDKEKVKIITSFLISSWSYLVRSHFNWVSLRTIVTGLRDGIIKTPSKPIII